MDITLMIEKINLGLKPCAIKHLKIEATENKNKTVSINITYFNRLYIDEPVTAMLTRYNEKDNTLYFKSIFERLLKEYKISYEKKEDNQCYVVASYFLNEFDFSNIDRFINSLFQFDPIGCCGKYNECSDAGICLHEDLIYSSCCMYRKNLESGKIFYGKNRNI
jgi:hypothetical protein